MGLKCDRSVVGGYRLAILCLVSLVAGPLAAAVPATPPTHVVSIPVTNLYSAPNPNADVVSQALLGRSVHEIQKKGKWQQIRTDDGYQGWAPKSALLKLERNEEPYATRPGFLEVTALQGNVYREPDVTKHAPMLVLPFGARLDPAAAPADERWIQIRLPDRRLGWIQMGDVVRDPPRLLIDEAIALAWRFIGVTYTWGGVSSFGLDCSGFTQLLVRARGTILPRDADQQAAWSGLEPVEVDSLLPGDLLYFGESMEQITHTGMYIGGGEFIHSTPRGHPGVQIGRLDNPTWKKIHLCSRRVR